jgi:formylglycine-generating enzyme required for sulfatase activity
MVRVPAGTYIAPTSLTPEAPFEMREFALDRTEVTAEAYMACVRAGRCTPATTERDPNDRTPCTAGVAGREQYPVNCVTWEQAKVFCEWAGKRLPTEFEWLYAAQSQWLVVRSPAMIASGDDINRIRDTQRRFPWGDEGAHGDACVNAEGALCPVGRSTRDRTPIGLQDMAFNVNEWTATHTAGYRGVRGCNAGQTDCRGFNPVEGPQHALPTAATGTRGFRCASGPENSDLQMVGVPPDPRPTPTIRIAAVSRAGARPGSTVRLPAFAIDAAPVTVAQYAACVAAEGCSGARLRLLHEMRYSDPDAYPSSMPFCNAGKPDRATAPLNCVSYQSAVAYCTWRGQRLPTEEEWRRALRTGALGNYASAPRIRFGSAVGMVDVPFEMVADPVDSDALAALENGHVTLWRLEADAINRQINYDGARSVLIFRCAQDDAAAPAR